MKVFTYPLFYKLVYRFGNITLTLLLSVYLVEIIIKVDVKIVYIIPFVVIILMIYFINKYFIYLYKILPARITADDEKLICTEFIFSEKELKIFYEDIVSLKGGIFEGRVKGLMKITDGKNKITIGFFHKIRNSKELETIILSKVPKTVYDSVIEKVSTERGKKPGG